jgi:O-antigen ligase
MESSVDTITSADGVVATVPEWPLRPAVIGAATASIVTAANATQGAYFSQSWGWVALAFLIPTTLWLILDQAIWPGRLRVAFASLLGALATWIALSSLWSLSSPGSIREFERIVVYIGVALAIAFVLRAGDGSPVLAGLLVGTSLICTYGLATRLLPDHFVTHDSPLLNNRLAQPLGYPNALGALAAIAILVALGLVSHGRPLSAAAAALIIPVHATTIYFTFSRGSWAALAVAFAGAIALDTRWLRSLFASAVVAVPTIACMLAASRQHELTNSDVPLVRAAHEGHQLALVVCAAAACCAVFAGLASSLAGRVTVSQRVRRLADVVAVCIVATSVVVAIVAVGGPRRGITRVKHEFDTLPTGGTADLNSRLFQIYGSGRAEVWPLAWREFKKAPLNGQGSGSFEYAWYQERPTTRVVRDAHSLYLETLAELGVIGLALLVSALLLPVVGGVKARGSRFVAFGVAAYLAWAVSAAIDWHWEMTGLTLTALLAGSVGFLGAAGASGSRVEGPRRAVALAVSIALSVFAVVSLVGNQALFAGRADLARRDWSEARHDADRARVLISWSAEPDLVLGDAEAGLGNRDGAASAYRDATAKDPRNWVAWLRLAQVAHGTERRLAYAKVHELNPLEHDLPGESSSG